MAFAFASARSQVDDLPVYALAGRTTAEQQMTRGNRRGCIDGLWAKKPGRGCSTVRQHVKDKVQHMANQILDQARKSRWNQSHDEHGRAQ